MDVSAAQSSTSTQYEWTPSFDLPPRVDPSSNEPTKSSTRTTLISKAAKWFPNALQQHEVSHLSPLCQACQSIFRGRRPDSELGGPHNHPLNQTIIQMEQSASQGCHLCLLRRSQLSAADVEGLSLTHEIKYGYWESRVGNGIAFQYTRNAATETSLQKSVALVADQPFSQTLKFSQTRRDELLRPGSSRDSLKQAVATPNLPSSLEMMRYWLKDCIENHTTCRELRPVNPRLPGRLIDIGPGEMIRPVLCSTQSLPPSTKYTTLSHCWGGKEFLRLLIGNERSFSEKIPVAQLSKTFRDAMEVTFRLGLRYIWIDSLCIIQDSPADWREQAALMGEVYRNAYCNIAATAAKDGTAGLFHRRTLLDVEPCRVLADWTRHPRQTYFCHAIGVWEREVEDQPLLSRAWVAQEVILAPRVIHFSRTEMFWECLERRACESYPDKIPNFTVRKLSLRPPRPAPELAWLSINDGNFPFHEVWTDVVGAYTRGDLTYKVKDKLIAISGMARTLPLPADNYLAGLWKQGLTEQLLWTTRKPETDDDTMARPSRASEYRAPTWSWASMDGAVLMQTPTLKALEHACVEIIETSIVLTDPRDPYGQVSGGIMRLIAPLAFSQLSERTITPTTRPLFRNGKLVDQPLPPGTSTQSITHRYLGQAHVNLFPDDEDPKVGAWYHTLLVSAQFGGCGLLLKPTGRQRGEYTRCGYFAVLTGLHPDSPARFMDACRDFTVRARQDDMLYEAEADVTREGIQRYVISLV